MTDITILKIHVTDFPILKIHGTDFPILKIYVTDVKVHVDELLSAQIWQNKLCATLSANVNINYRLPIKVY